MAARQCQMLQDSAQLVVDSHRRLPDELLYAGFGIDGECRPLIHFCNGVESQLIVTEENQPSSISNTAKVSSKSSVVMFGPSLGIAPHIVAVGTGTHLLETVGLWEGAMSDGAQAPRAADALPNMRPCYIVTSVRHQHAGKAADALRASQQASHFRRRSPAITSFELSLTLNGMEKRVEVALVPKENSTRTLTGYRLSLMETPTNFLCDNQQTWPKIPVLACNPEAYASSIFFVCPTPLEHAPRGTSTTLLQRCKSHGRLHIDGMVNGHRDLHGLVRCISEYFPDDTKASCDEMGWDSLVGVLQRSEKCWLDAELPKDWLSVLQYYCPSQDGVLGSQLQELISRLNRDFGSYTTVRELDDAWSGYWQDFEGTRVVT